MDRMRFTSRLTTEDIEFFLIRYGGFCGITMNKESFKYSTELIHFFSYQNQEYRLFCEDFGMRITNIQGGIEKEIPEVKPSPDDWFCFLRSKFGKEYMEHFSQVFDAREIILEEAKYISQISYNEMVILLKQILEDNKDYLSINEIATIDIIEVESFYYSERRFWLYDRNTKQGFYMRLSDTGIVSPRMSSYVFLRYLISRFGDEYLIHHFYQSSSEFEEKSSASIS